MSTLKANTINNISASVGGITIDSSGTVSGSLPSPNRNLLYNGAMAISQRGTSTTGIASSSYNTADRWVTAIDGSAGTWTQDIQADAPIGSGFRRSLRMLCTTAQAAPASNVQLRVDQRLEGQDVQRIRKGTASAQKLTLSFWVKSSTTGTYVATLFDTDNNRRVSATYSISASATWEQKTITFPADTTGAFDNDNAQSLIVGFWLSAGSNFTSGSLATAWQATNNANLAVGQTNLAAATNNYWQITGVQLETGDATEFEFKSFGQELQECQRYYYRLNGGYYGLLRAGSATSFTWAQQHPVPMRAPTTAIDVIQTGLGIMLEGNDWWWTTSITFGSSSPFNCTVTLNHSRAGVGIGTMGHVMGNNPIGFSAEL